jgi:hypothetical protein
LAFAEDLAFGDWKPVPLHCQAGQPRNPLPSQDFALCEVPIESSSENPTSPAQEFLQASLIGNSALAVQLGSTNLKSPSEGLKNVKCKKGTPPVRPPIPYVPPTDLHEKQESGQIKVKLLDGTKFQMSTYSSGNNEEYSVHVIFILLLI